MSYFTRVILFDKKMFILTHFYTLKKNSKVSARERSSLHCITTMTTERTLLGFKMQLVIHPCLLLSMNSEESKYVT